ncbi:hypothetical protein [Stenotrophomonas sp. GZD-301]|uniref:hypothetical protein n=1 Tax=Stenotrophomonas sp. GZD-301 TaxID=3404814 RepID=UPI003BB55819
MNEHDPTHHDDDLSARLRALPDRRVPPARVWQGIAAQLHDDAQQRRAEAAGAAQPAHVAAAARARPRPRRWALGLGIGLAAALAVLVVVPMPTPHTPPPSMLQRQADVLAGEYQQAMAALPAATVPGDYQPALHELDASARSIRAAIAENPRSGYLLGQLQRTYALRLELTQQAVMAATGMPT